MGIVVPGNVSGVWYDATQPGHGLIVEQLSPGALFAVWYTFDPEGRQAWFLANGAFDGVRASLPNVRPQGGFFEGVLGSLTQPAFGQLQMQFLSCSKARLEYDLPSGFGIGALNLTRLTQPAGVACDSAPPVGATLPHAGMTGVWYDRTQPGRGLVVEALPNGNLFASWFTYGGFPSGGQAWFVGTGASANAGNVFNVPLARPTGTRFPPAFNPAQVMQTPAGQATVKFDSCDAATLTYDVSLGRGTTVLSRLSKPQGVVCVDSAMKSAPLTIGAETLARRKAHSEQPFTGDAVVALDVRHGWRGDLRISLRDPGGREFPVFEGDPSDAADDLRMEHRIALSRAEVDGEWTLVLSDRRSGDVGELVHWSLSFESKPHQP